MIAKQIVHIFIAMLLLVSMAGVSVKQHYCCGKHVYSTLSLFDQNCMDGKMPSNSPCCKDDYQFIQVGDDFQVVSYSLEQNMEFLQIATMVPMNLFFPEQEKNPAPKFHNYRPPLIQQDIPVLIQSFLI